MRMERRRFATFEMAPDTIHSFLLRAKGGLFFSKSVCKLQCFACAKNTEEWQKQDFNVLHNRDCPMLGGKDCGNVPIIEDQTGSNFYMRLMDSLISDRNMVCENYSFGLNDPRLPMVDLRAV